MRAKGEAPEDLLTNIELLRAELMETQRQLRFREAELKARSEEFDRDRARLEHLRSQSLIVEVGLDDSEQDESSVTSQRRSDADSATSIRRDEKAETTAEETPWEKAVW